MIAGPGTVNLLLFQESILGLTGGTPLVKTRLSPRAGVSIFAKLEYCNPSGSLKDRIALKMIEDAERRGLSNSKVLVEPSSGNTGISVAMVGRLKGYRVVIVLPEAVTREKVVLLQALGAEVRFAKNEVEAATKWRRSSWLSGSSPRTRTTSCSTSSRTSRTWPPTTRTLRGRFGRI